MWTSRQKETLKVNRNTTQTPQISILVQWEGQDFEQAMELIFQIQSAQGRERSKKLNAKTDKAINFYQEMGKKKKDSQNLTKARSQHLEGEAGVDRINKGDSLIMSAPRVLREDSTSKNQDKDLNSSNKVKSFSRRLAWSKCDENSRAETET